MLRGLHLEHPGATSEDVLQVYLGKGHGVSTCGTEGPSLQLGLRFVFILGFGGNAISSIFRALLFDFLW